MSQPEAADGSQSQASQENSDPVTRNHGRGRGFNGDAEVPGTPLTYKEVIFEALKEWLEENQVGQCTLYTYETLVVEVSNDLDG